MTITTAPTARIGVMTSFGIPNRAESTGDMTMVMATSLEKISEVFSALT